MDFSAQVFRALFPSAVFNTQDGTVHLTFDDGPHPVATPKVLDILRRFDIRATFFLVGRHVQQLPHLAKQIVAEHHHVGNHSYNHTNLLLRSKKVICQEITKTNETICESTGITPTFFRAPYGFYDYRTVKVVQSLGMQLVHWTNDVRDYETACTASQAGERTRRVGRGSIVLLHDNDSTAEKITSFLPALIEELRNRGFAFAPRD